MADAPRLAEWLDHYLAVAVGALDPVPGKQFVLAGGEVPWDQCDCDGQVWSRIVQVLPVLGQVKANGKPCNVMHWEVVMAVGVIRCVATPNTAGKLPSGAKMTLDGHVFANDLAQLIQALSCDEHLASIGAGVPVGAAGGCAGSEVQFTLKVRACGCE